MSLFLLIIKNIAFILKLSQLKIKVNKVDGVAQKVNLIRQYIEDNKNPRVQALNSIIVNRFESGIWNLVPNLVLTIEWPIMMTVSKIMK